MKQTKKFLKAFGKSSTVIALSKSSIEARYKFPMADSHWKLLKQSNKNGHNVYFTVNETNGKGRTAKDITRIRALFADDDTPRAEPRQDWPMPPSIIVRTSKVDEGNKYHYYWLTSTTNFDEWERCMLGLIDRYKTDISIHDISRIMRLPGFVNNKNKSRSKVIENNGTAYKWTDVIKAFPPVDREKRVKLLNKAPDGEFNEHKLCDLFRKGKNAGDISNSVNSLIMHKAMEGRSEYKIRTYIKQLYDTIPPDNYLDPALKDRYDACYKQVGKWIKTAKKKANEHRKPKEIDVQVDARPLVPEMQLTEFDPDIIPECVYSAAQEVGTFLANGATPSIISAMSITCALLGKSVRIHEIGSDKTTPCSSGIIVAMETGTRKTEVYKLMNKPFIKYEKAIQEQWEKDKHAIESTVFVYNEQIKAIESEVKKGVKKGMSDAEMKSHILKMAELKAKIEALQTVRPSLMVKDITEEAVIPKLAQNQGTLAVISDDSRNIIKNILGRYSNTSTAEGWLIDGIGGTTIKYNRTKDEGTEVIVDDPCLNVYLMVQPDMAITLKDHEVYKRSGLAARVPIFFYPIDPLDIVKNSDRSRRLNKGVMKNYYTRLTGLCHRRIDNPLIVELSEGAEKRFNEFNNQFVQLLQDAWKGEYRRTNKMITQAVIMSTVMAAIDDPDFTTEFRSKSGKYKLGRRYANMGCRYVETLYDGMIKSTTGLDSIEAVDAAIRFATSLLKYYDKGKIYEGFVNTSHLQNSFAPITKENRNHVIELMTDNNWLLTEISDKYGDLNRGFPQGKAKPGDTIYHLNVDSVRSVLRRMTKQQQFES